jgi:hypothetical protein
MLAGSVCPAEALTIRDVIELTRAGITEEVLLALIDVDGGVYANDAATLKALKEAGVSERVMVALVRSGRERRVPDPPPPPPLPDQEPAQPPPVVVIEHREPEVREVLVPVPVYVPVYTNRPHRRGDGSRATVDTTPVSSFQPGYVPSFQAGLPAVRHDPPPPAAPVYWGFGGKLRPDAWGQPPADTKAADGKPTDGKTADGKTADRDGRPGRR